MKTILIAISSLLLTTTALAEPGTMEQAVSTELNVGFEPVFNGHAFERPIALDHAGDGSGKLYVMGQLGTVEVLDGPEDDSPEMLLDITERVLFLKNENEQGLLGIAFHPKFADNGQFFLYYNPRPTDEDSRRRTVVSRFTVENGKADPASEELLLTIEQPYWNHNGGTLRFGPDGMLYIAVGDGGKFDDPHDHGQNPKTLLASVLRIDVDHRSTVDGKKLPYAIPSDNPFADKPEQGRGEVWAYGLRNVWRMEFDAKTGELWAGDVGQNVWEEIDILEAGKNYGWNVREGKHALEKQKGVPPTKPREGDELVEPVWDYHHDIGKSITGGHIVRCKSLPQLDGMYLYADYISGSIYALDYDREANEVRKNHILREKGLPVTSFGHDAQGESYFMQDDGVIYRLVVEKQY
ncbi:PQQ-dependent sugar dehydrogenase [Adhaeretor mobilis]|uniref:Quinoprotein glucose dehydrogenase B n=1 Tax=Adhaeretor mobilis TaxID=1930276 RepID=A0A517N0K6_9BACT|nr:PQQ-dependent sugar dehydrogenase [Adhaeretor mobilis]QDT00669.1 Quinoprotein glucose dehydrogenase B precursor [Adhaeretor mobilis]